MTLVRTKLPRLLAALPLAVLGGAMLATTACDDAAGVSVQLDATSDSTSGDLGTDATLPDGTSSDDLATDATNPSDTTADGTSDGSSDMSAPVPCVANSDCPGGSVCLLREGVCGPAVGPGGPGSLCDADTQCQSGACIDGRCAAPCNDDAHCPSSLTCEQTTVDGATVGICVGQPQPCTSSGDCPSGELCVVDRSGGQLVMTCGGPVGGGDLGSTCQADANCAQNLCLGGVCTLPCARVIDCSATSGFTCDSASVPTTGGSPVDTNVCVPVAPDACLSDNDCPDAGERCVANKTATDLTFTCGAPNPGGRDTGANCAGDADCAQNLCLAGQCAAPCQVPGRDCPADYGCEISPVSLGGGLTDSASLCRAPTLCDEDDACLLSEVCYVRREQSDISMLCRAPNLGSQPGQVCSEDSDCRSNLCVDTRFRRVCSQPCVDNSDCDAPGDRCVATTLDALDGTDVPVSICMPAPAPSCTSQAACASGTTCAVVANEAGTALETVCIPSPGGTAPGVACTANSQCSSQLCLGGFCSAPCTAANQCGNGQLCSTSNVTKDGLNGSFQLCQTPPDTLCSSSSQCSSTNRVCGDVRTTANSIDTACTFPNTSGAGLGTACTSDAQCFHTICSQLSSECTVVCALDNDCATGQICTAYRFGLSGGGTDNLQLCARSCVDDDSCRAPGGNPTSVCTVNSNFVDNTIDQVCEDRVGPGDIGAPCTGTNGLQDGNMCIRGICLRTTLGSPTTCTSDANCTAPYRCLPSGNGTNVCAIDECTALCDGASDCTSSTFAGNALLTCSQSITITPPNGGAAQTISACARN